MTPEDRGPGLAVAAGDLFAHWQNNGDRAARDRLVERYMPLARKLALRYIRSGEPLDDLVQVASLGLVKAIDRYDTGRGTAFTSYAVPTILGELKRYFRDQTWTLHLERGAKERAARVADARNELGSSTGRSVTVAELAEYLEWSIEDVIDGLQVWEATQPLSLDEPIALSSGGTPVARADTVGALDERLSQAEQRITLGSAARRLTELERQVLYLRFGEDLTQTEIAGRIHVSQMHVSRVQRRALARLGKLIESSA